MKILSGDKYLYCFNGKVFSLLDIAHKDITYHMEDSDITGDDKHILINCSNAVASKIVLIGHKYSDSMTKINRFRIVQHNDKDVAQATHLFETFQIVDGYVCVTHDGVLYKITPQACRVNTSYRTFQRFRLTPFIRLIPNLNENALRIEYEDADLDCGLK